MSSYPSSRAQNLKNSLSSKCFISSISSFLAFVSLSFLCTVTKRLTLTALRDTVIVGPLRLIWHHVFYRFFSSHVQVIGTTALSSFIRNLVQYVLSRGDAAQTRILFDRVKSYERIWTQSPYCKKNRDWLSYVKVNGTAGRWIAKPGTDRAKDDVVVYFIHGLSIHAFLSQTCSKC